MQWEDKNRIELVLYNTVTIITITQFLAFAIFNIILLAYVTNFDRLITAFAESQPQVNSISNLTDQIRGLKNFAANQSSELRDIKKLNSEEVQLLKSMIDAFSKTTTQSTFGALGIFFLGITLVIYGLKLTLKVADRRTSRYFKAMMWALITPAIALIAAYQIGLPLHWTLYKSEDSFFLVSVLLMIPAGIVIFLLTAEGRFINISREKDAL